MATQIKGSQIQDGSITSEDVDDDLERELTKARVSSDDSVPGFLSGKIVQGSGVLVEVVGAAGADQTLRISAAGGGGGGGSALIVSGAAGSVQYMSTPGTVVFDEGTGFQVSDLGGGSAKIAIASHFKYVTVDGYETLAATGSDTLRFRSLGGVVVGTNRYDALDMPTLKDVVIDATPLSSSLAARIGDMETGVSASFWVQEQTSFGMSPSVGGSRLYARADHTHGTPSIPYASSVVAETTHGMTASVGTSTSLARADHTHGTPPASAGAAVVGLYGTGYDGDLVVSGLYTQTQPREWMNLTIASGGVYKPAGFPVIVRSALTIAAGGSLNDDGNSAVGAAGGAALGGRGYLDAQSTAGGAGWSLSSNNFANGNVSGAITMTMPNRAGVTPRGGNGGNSSTRSGGVAGTASQLTTGARLSQVWASGRHPGGPIKGGSGGGGGAITVTTPTLTVSGGGGSGGGFVYVCAASVSNSGTISANGGAGASASVVTISNSAGGGGGGAAGCVLIVTNTPASQLGTLTATGGAGGAAAGTGSTSGAAGADGSVHVVSFGGE